MNLPRSSLMLGLLTSGLLSACGSVAPAPSLTAAGDAVATPTASYPYAVTLAVTAADAPEQLAARYDGKVIAFRPQQGYALLATRSATLPQDSAHAPVRESNARAVSGGGMTAFASGKATVWASGKATVWASGQFQVVPENTSIWTQIHLEQAQKLAPHLGQGVKVAMIDTGLDLSHEAFQGSLAPQNEWRDFYDDDNDPSDVGTFGEGGYGHGTNTAGIVLQIAPAATILPLRALGPDGSGDVLSVARAIDWAVSCHASVINLSLGTGSRSKIIQDAMDRASEAGVLITVSAGNEGQNRLNYPADDAASGKHKDRVISVGSVSRLDLKSSFSNYSSHLELMAPGEEVYGPAPHNMLAAWSGTSMSAPVAAGALALALGEHPDARLAAPSSSPEAVAAHLLASADPVDALPGNLPYRGKLGSGRANLETFLRSLKAGDKGN
ncbi:S8 family peptidase [Deinococcus sonorensis]|uniref:S8 family serine peptidase n=2 Tax=Deinococcus sonorensis TaxID=309891 RepID=A0AAU7UA15_9DEIO